MSGHCAVCGKVRNDSSLVGFPCDECLNKYPIRSFMCYVTAEEWAVFKKAGIKPERVLLGGIKEAL